MPIKIRAHPAMSEVKLLANASVISIGNGHRPCSADKIIKPAQALSTS